jgi:uncharacterized protein
MPRVIDPHVHLQLGEQEPATGRSHRLADYREATADLDLAAYGVLVMAPAGDLDATRSLNDAVLGVRDDDASAYAMCSVHPTDGDEALAEIERVATRGAKGLKLHPNTQGFDVADPGVAAVVTRAGEHGLPVLFDTISVTDPGQPEKFLGLAVGCPGARIVLAHSFGPKFQMASLFSVLTRYPWFTRNAWLELSGVVALFGGSPYAEQLAWVCRNHGLDRVMWASDYPFYSPDESMAGLRGLGFGDAELDQVLSGTATELYGV